MSMSPRDYENAKRAHRLANDLSIPFDAAWKIATCVSKTRYHSQEEAEEAAKAYHQSVYLCPICEKWHATSRKPVEHPTDLACAQHKRKPSTCAKAHARAMKEACRDDLLLVLRGGNWMLMSELGNAIKVKHPDLDAKRDLGCRNLRVWIDSTELCDAGRDGSGALRYRLRPAIGKTTGKPKKKEKAARP